MKLTSGLAAVALAASTLAAAAPSGAVAPTDPAGTRAVSAGADWLAAQLTNGIVRNTQYDFDDFGLSADIAFALDDIGGREATVTRVVDAIEPKSESWVAGFTPGRVYAGSLAKLVAVVQAAGQDPRAFNGTDQVARLEATVSAAPGTAGRVEDAGVDPTDPFDADFVNVIGQSFAARALTAAGSSRAAATTAFLLDQQCDDGSFRASLTADKAAAEQGCAVGATGELDTTALTVVNILDTPGASASARGAAYLAANWLRSQQAADGSFSAGDLGTNANTTGLAGWALAEAGYDAAATRAAGWLRGLQVADLAPCATTLSSENGAIAYKAADLSAARAAGRVAVEAQDAFRRATAQALPALARVPAGSAVAVAAPATAVESSTVTLTVAGLGAGEPACVSLGSTVRSITGTGAPVQVAIALPAGAATRTADVRTLGGVVSASTTVTATPPPAVAEPTVGELSVAKVVRVARTNRFPVSVECTSTVACTGKITVRTARKVALRDGAKKRVVVVAKGSYTVDPGDTERVVVTLTKAGRAVVDTKRTRVVARQTGVGADPVTTKFWIRRK